jgi:hypothetical protein
MRQLWRHKRDYRALQTKTFDRRKATCYGFFFNALSSKPEMMPINWIADRASSSDKLGKNGRP